MNNISSLKSRTSQSPKTPGGISKSLLTPCRRVGLSRNWKKNGPSPFISPLGSNNEVKQEKLEHTTRKRKERVVEPFDEDIQRTPKFPIDVNTTPSRNLDVPRRKKSKTLFSVVNKTQKTAVTETCKQGTSVEDSSPLQSQCTENKQENSPKENSAQNKSIDTQNKHKKSNECKEVKTVNPGDKLTRPSDKPISERSPNDLKKECVVVIQKKAFKDLVNPKRDISDIRQCRIKGQTSQTLFDSDSDEVPLCHLNKKEPTKLLKVDDGDFIEKKKDKPTKTETVSAKSPKSKSKKDKIEKPKLNKPAKEMKHTSQSSYDDDDDFENKKTIVIRRTYDKVMKPQRAKSTGSITQKDIDDIKARINMKKKLLLAQSLTPDTAELRSLIKKWQKGCQDALMELLELMRGKSPEQNMDYSDMLKALKIPASLVGYDSDNDCFVSPNDEDIVLGNFKISINNLLPNDLE